MKRAVFLALCIVPFTSSCGGPGGGEVRPKSGTWGIAFSAPSVNTCGTEVDITSGDFRVTDNGDGTFTVDPQDGNAPFDCTIDGDSFECPERVHATLSQSGIDAVVTVKIREEGTFSSSTEATGVRSGSAVCVGSACSTVEQVFKVTFPCEAEAEFVASHKQ